MYFNGFGVQQNYAQAVAWFKKAAQQGSANAESNLGYMYSKGLGVALDAELAHAWLKKAASHGSDNAKSLLASMGSRNAPQPDQDAASAAEPGAR
jgi:TPR repeat protein